MPWAENGSFRPFSSTFNEPERFDLTYIGEDGKEHRPYMVHRALLGSMERFFGVLIEHYGGAFQPGCRQSKSS
jgi:threonyl-tRNA synthetase